MMAFNRDKHNATKARFAARKAELGFMGALKSEGGAIDLASIMVGVIVIGVIAGVIAATVFAVIPWAQDKAASQALDSVNQAESVAFAQATDAGAGVYLDKAGIVKHDGANNTPGLLQDSKSLAIISVTGATYTAASLSSTGNIYYTTSANPNTAVKIAKGATLQATIDALNTATGKTFLTTSFNLIP
jgi:hypothetical protein